MARKILLLLFLYLVAWPGFAQPYPSKPIRLVIPWPAGGPTDVLGRVFAERLSKVLGQPLIIDNRVGASGAIGADIVARAVPDGYTLMVQSMTRLFRRQAWQSSWRRHAPSPAPSRWHPSAREASATSASSS